MLYSFSLYSGQPISAQLHFLLFHLEKIGCGHGCVVQNASNMYFLARRKGDHVGSW